MTKTTTKKPGRVRWVHTCYGGERKTLPFPKHKTCPTCGEAPKPWRRRRTAEQIYERRAVKILETLESALAEAEADLEALNDYESDQDAQPADHVYSLASDTEAAIDDTKEALIQAFYRYSTRADSHRTVD